MNEPTSDPLMIMFPYTGPTHIEDWGYYDEVVSQTGINNSGSSSGVGDARPISYGVHLEVYDKYIAKYPSSNKEVSQKIWVNWRFNAKKFTIVSSESSIVFPSGTNTYESGVEPTVFTKYPVPNLRFVQDSSKNPPEDLGVIPSCFRQFKYTYDNGEDEPVSRWLLANEPPFSMFVHRGKYYIGFPPLLSYVNPVPPLPPPPPILTAYSSFEVTSSRMTLTYPKTLADDTEVTVTIIVAMVGTYY
jgi:hypothetical protein